MLIVTPMNDRKQLKKFNKDMHGLFDLVAGCREYNRSHGTLRGSRVEIDTRIEPYRLKLNYQRSWVDAIARKHGHVLPWKRSLEKLEELRRYLEDVDPLGIHEYECAMSVLTGR